MSSNKKITGKINFSRFGNDLMLGKALILGVCVSIFWSIYFSLVTISMPYQIELREGTALLTTKFFLGGSNPYILENQPLALNVYGMGYSLIVLPFAFIFGNTLLLHRAVTFVFILSSAAIAGMLVYKTRKNIPLALGCAAFIMTGLIGHGGIGAFPAAMGTFLFLVTVLIPFVRSFDKTGLFISAFAAIFSFYTKPYFVFGAVVVGTYLFLFISKKKAVFYSLFFLSLFAVFFAAVRIAFPLYFVNIIIGNIFLTVRTAKTLAENLTQLFMYFYPVLSVIAAILLKDLYLNPSWRITAYDSQLFDMPNWDQPFVKYSANYFFYSSVFALVVFLLILGPHGGDTGMNYANQLLLPLFSCWLFQKVDLTGKFRVLIALILLFNLYAWEYTILNPVMLEQKESREWAHLFDYIKSSSSMLNSQVIVSKSVEMNLNLVDSGQTIIFYEIQPYPEYVFMGPSYKEIRSDGFLYTKSINRAIEKQRFDLIVITKEKAIIFDIKLLHQYYQLVKEIKVNMPQTGQLWTQLIWEPVPK